MAQIKILDLNNAYSLTELSPEDANDISGGRIYGPFGILLYKREVYKNGKWDIKGLSTPA
jgi:hypothetical protein